MVHPSETLTLRSIYFDTPTWALRHAGLTLRVRQRDNQWIQTLKTDRTLEGGVSKAFEITLLNSATTAASSALTSASLADVSSAVTPKGSRVRNSIELSGFGIGHSLAMNESDHAKVEYPQPILVPASIKPRAWMHYRTGGNLADSPALSMLR